ncbi:hypothetical protein JCM8208_004039 [Rhodotorula glutinis]
MALAYLASWLPSLGGGAPGAPQAAAGPPSNELSEEQLHVLHAQWLRMQSSHQAESLELMGRLVAENNELKERLAKAQRDLKDVTAGRKADEEELRRAEKEIKRLTGGNVRLVVAVLDLDTDLFAPEIFHQHNVAQAAVEAIRRKLLESLSSLEPAQSDKTWRNVVLIFWRRDPHFVQQLVAHGFFGSAREFDDFIVTFNRTDPLFMIIVEQSNSGEQALRRERAFAVLFAQHPLCYRLVLGRWAYDLHFAELLAPTNAKDRTVAAAFPTKILFVEPHIGAFLPAQLLRRRPQMIVPDGLLRRHALSDARAHKAREVDYALPLWQQDPPICLDHYLAPSRCHDERCAFSHQYRIPPDVLEALRFEVSRTPCPLVLAGYECGEASKCHFAHACPRGSRCAEPPAPRYGPARAATSPKPAAHGASSPPLPADLARQAAAAPSSTRSALARLLGGAASSSRPAPGPRHAQQRPHASPTLRSPPLKHHLLPASPFGHPLSLADDEQASAPPPSVTDAVDLTDEELARLLERARREEEEYERGLQEDPFSAGAGVGAASTKGRAGGSKTGAAQAGAAGGDGRAVWEAARSGRGSQAAV